MLKRYLAAATAAVALVSIGAGLAQVPGLFIASPLGTEQINVVNKGAQIATVTLNQIRNAAGAQLVPTGTTVNTTVPNTVSKLIAAGAITTWNVTFPLAPYDGEMLEVACPGGAATVAMTATAPSGVAVVGTAFTACTAGGAAANTAEWSYSIGANSWFRIQ